MQGLLPLTAKIALMSLAYAAGGPFDLNTLVLFINDITPTPESITADFTPATYDGYADVVTPVFGTAFVDEDGNVVLTAPSIDFVSTGTTTQELVYGWLLKKTAGGALEYVKRFETPKPMGTFVGQGFTLQPRIVYGE